MSYKAIRWSALAGVGLALSAPASADTLKGALVDAYLTNPTLLAARANQRATDETVPIARSSGLPSLSGTGTYSEFVHDSDATATAAERQLSANASLAIPIYSGGSVRNSVKAAKTRVEAGQANLRGTESFVFTQVVAGYMDVILREAIVRLNRNNVDILKVNLQATSDRYEIGDLTRTDVAQSEARLALAQGDLRAAEANLVSARETYIQLVGNPPGDLEAPPPLPGLPDDANQAVEIALDNNPDLIAARESARAADFDIDVAGAGRLPRLEVFTNGSYSDFLNTLGGAQAGAFTQAGTSATAGIRATIPFYQGGRPAAQERQAQARFAAALEQEIAAERDVIATVRAAHSSLQAARAIVESSQAAVEAAELSLEGVRAENTVGNRTILDILNAQQELVRAQVQLVTARRNAYVAGFSMLAAMGRAEARDLGLEEEEVLLYDPQVNYDRVRGKAFDWDMDPDPVAQSTRTVDTPAQDGDIFYED